MARSQSEEGRGLARARRRHHRSALMSVVTGSEADLLLAALGVRPTLRSGMRLEAFRPKSVVLELPPAQMRALFPHTEQATRAAEATGLDVCRLHMPFPKGS